MAQQSDILGHCVALDHSDDIVMVNDHNMVSLHSSGSSLNDISVDMEYVEKELLESGRADGLASRLKELELENWRLRKTLQLMEDKLNVSEERRKQFDDRLAVIERKLEEG